MDMLLLFATILLLAVNGGCLAVCISRNRTDKPSSHYIGLAGRLAAVQLVLLYSLNFVLCQYTLGANRTAVLLTLVLVCALASAQMLLADGKTTPLRRFFHRGVRLTALALLLELAVFCGWCYTLHPEETTIGFPCANMTYDPEAAEWSSNTLLVHDTTELVFQLEKTDVNYVQFSCICDDNFYQCSVGMKDGNFSRVFKDVSAAWMNSSQESMSFSINPYGTLHELRLGIKDLSGEFRLTGMTVSNVKPYGFSFLRFAVVAGILVLCAAIRIFGWYRITYNRRCPAHRAAVLAVLAVSLCTISAFILPGQELSDYAETGKFSTADPYAQTLDAWEHGQLHLTLEPDPLLAELKNPYDPSQRSEAGASVAWDRAYYNGKYYSYFGVAPVVFVYYPFYLLTGKLPTLNIATCILAIFAMITMFGMIMSLIKKYCKQVNFLLLLCGLAAAAGASGIYLCLNYSDRYYLVYICGMLFLYLFLWLGLEATMAKKNLSRCLLLAGCGLAIACTVLSRPQQALYAVLLVPPFLGLIRRKQLGVRQKTAAVTSFAIPLLAGAAAVMAYNAARFSSPFDFGSTYQLTVNDTSANIVRLSSLPAAIGYYFLTPLKMGGVFPFFTQPLTSFPTYGQFSFADEGFGLLVFPCVAAGLLLLPMTIRKRSARAEKRWVFYLAFLLALLIALVDFCMAGYVSRYLCDILPVLAVFCVLVILDAQQQMRRLAPVYGAFSKCAAAVLIATPLMMLAILLSAADWCAMWNSMPEFYFRLRDLLVFWR